MAAALRRGSFTFPCSHGDIVSLEGMVLRTHVLSHTSDKAQSKFSWHRSPVVVLSPAGTASRSPCASALRWCHTPDPGPGRDERHARPHEAMPAFFPLTYPLLLARTASSRLYCQMVSYPRTGCRDGLYARPHEDDARLLPAEISALVGTGGHLATCRVSLTKRGQK